MKVVVIASQKGGSGKTTTTGHLAVACEQAGQGPAVLVDMTRKAPRCLVELPPGRKAGICSRSAQGAAGQAQGAC